MIEIETLDAFDGAVAQARRGSRSMSGWQVQNLDLTGREEALDELDPAGALFLGCTVADPVAERLRARGALLFPDLPDLPFDPWRAELYSPAELGDFGFILYRNGLVLALHGFACVAGFMAGSSLPQVAEGYSGVWRWIHDKAGPLAIAFVVAATTFSLCTQAYVLGNAASTLAWQGDVSPALLLTGILPHVIPELMALFLPLAAWIIASRRKDWHELLAATFVTTAVAAPVLVIAAFLEVYVSPDVILALRG